MPDSWVITGAASGIGLATARQVAALGSNVLLADVDAVALAAAEAVVRQGASDANSIIVAKICDVTSSADMRDLRDEAVRVLPGGVVDVLFLNAGVQASGVSVGKGRDKDWEWVLSVNVLGAQRGIFHFLPLLKQQAPRPSRIVATASVMGIGLAGPPSATSAYCVSKHALVALMESLSTELHLAGLSDQIRTAVLCPGGVSSEFWNIERQERQRRVEDRRQMSSRRQETLRAFFQPGGAIISPEAVARQLIRGLKRDEFIIDTHAGLVPALAKVRAEYIVAGKRPAEALVATSETTIGWLEKAQGRLSAL